MRIIAATHQNLEERVRQGLFREDLMHRLNVVRLRLPPLSERQEDIAPLARHFLQKCARELAVEPKVLSDAALKVMCAFRYPGNVRQLENVLERSAAFCDSGVIEIKDLPGTVRGSKPSSRVPAGLGGIPLVDLEREALIQTLKLCNGNKAETARRLGITEKSVYNKLKRQGLM